LFSRHGAIPVKLIFGLGNPGPRYVATRHNIGCLSVDRLAKRHGIAMNRHDCACVYGAGSILGIPAVIARPLVFMNMSGEAVGLLMQRLESSPADILVIHDDMDIAFGLLKIKIRGGSAGHRGILSIIEHLHTDLFLRIRVGIGAPRADVDPRDYVLQDFTAAEQQQLDAVLEKATLCCETVLAQGVEQAMNLFHAERIAADTAP